MFQFSTHSEGTRSLAYGFSSIGGTPVDTFKHLSSTSEAQAKVFLDKLLTTASSQSTPLEAYSWLREAAECYRLSTNMRDFIIVPDVPIIISDIPNTNGVAFPKQQLLAFNPKQGRPAYQTFAGKACFVEHANTDISKACGLVLDSIVKPVALGKGLIQVVCLLAFDRYKNSGLANQILSKERNAYSMGAYFDHYTMSDLSPPDKKKLAAPLYVNARNELVYALLAQIEGFEVSSVRSPAFISATNTEILEVT